MTQPVETADETEPVPRWGLVDVQREMIRVYRRVTVGRLKAQAAFVLIQSLGQIAKVTTELENREVVLQLERLERARSVGPGAPGVLVEARTIPNSQGSTPKVAAEYSHSPAPSADGAAGER